MKALDAETVRDLERLIAKGRELHAWVVVDEAPLHAKEIGVAINDPYELSYQEIEMEDSEYAPTLIEALTKAARRWR
jgi:hypothetical protein